MIPSRISKPSAGRWSIFYLVALIVTETVSATNYTFSQLGQDLVGEGEGDYSSTVSLSIDGKTAVVGGYLNDDNGDDSGHARVYNFNGTSWVQMGSDIDGVDAGNLAGFTVDISNNGQIIAVGSVFAEGGRPSLGGQVRVFQYVGNTWQQMGEDIQGLAVGDYYVGNSIDLSEDGTVLAAVGYFYLSIFQYNGTAWNMMGDSINRGWQGFTRHQISMSADGTVVAVGDDERVRAFKFEDGNWTQIGQTLEGVDQDFGMTVSLNSDGDILGIGAPKNASGYGEAHVYEYTGATWSQYGSTLSSGQYDDKFGFEVQLSNDGKRFAVASILHDDNDNLDSGATRLYEYDGEDWVQIGETLVGEEPNDQLGWTVDLSGDGKILAVGVDSSNNGVSGNGHVAVYELTELTPAPAPAGVTGDPHFKMWNGEMYDFHGVCDLVLLKNHEFKNGYGMDIHIRTKKMKQWSFISNAVLRIGEDTFEVMGDAHGKTAQYWVNGYVVGNTKDLTDNAILQHTISGYPIFYQQTNSKQHQFNIDLGGNEKIVMKTWKDLVSVDIHGATEINFGNSLGLMGTFREGWHVARDETTILTDINSFGQEWQVLVNEPTYFHSHDGPQAPEKCTIPAATSLRRRLAENAISHEVASIACGSVSEADRDVCIFDVMATNDLEAAEAYL